MARSRLVNPSNDLIQDSGSVLWSFVQGEQLEFPVILNFIEGSPANYIFEAVVVEAENLPSSDTQPTSVRAGGVQNTLTTRVPTYRGVWNGTQAYSREEVVLYNGKYYRLFAGVARTNADTPDVDGYWIETQINRVYIQFPKVLSLNWSVQPTVGQAVYGFFELRVTAPVDSIFQKTWKPVRGMVQLMFSPTELVPG
jgi:hypothetical protein